MKKFFDIKFLKFLIVGVLNTIVGNGLSFVLLNLTGLGFWGSSAISYIIASVMSYFLNKNFTFQNKEKGVKPVLRFAINIAICYFLAYGIAQPFVKWLLSLPSISIWVNNLLATSFMIKLFKGNLVKFTENLALLVGMILFTLFNYVGQRFFAFKEDETKEDNAKEENTKENKKVENSTKA